MNENKYKLYQFGAEWCEPCCRQREEFKKSNLVGFDYEFKDCDEEVNDALVEKYSIKELPTMILLEKNSKAQIKKWVGTHSVSSIQEYVNDLITDK